MVINITVSNRNTNSVDSVFFRGIPLNKGWKSLLGFGGGFNKDRRMNIQRREQSQQVRGQC